MTDNSSEDEDLRRAIAMSLAESSTTAHQDSTEDFAGSSQATTVTVNSVDLRNSSLATSGGNTPGSLLASLDRKAMEGERLARIAQRSQKRQRSISPPPMSRPVKSARVVDLTSEAPPSSSAPARIEKSSTPMSTAAITSTQNGSPAPPPGLKYPTGRLLKTWSFGHPRPLSGSDIKIEEVLERRTLRTAVLSAFQYDWEWLFTKIDTKRTNLLFVVHARTTQEREDIRYDLESLGPNVRVCLPPMDGAFCMHSKLMLLFHPDKLRVVIPSANLVPYDWGETGIMENTVWVIDLPRLEQGVPDPQPTTGSGKESTESTHANGSSKKDGAVAERTDTPFLENLKLFLRKQNITQNVMEGFDNFNWTATAPYRFVGSIGSPVYGQDLAKSGITGLAAAVQELGLTTTGTQVDMCASSVGALTTPFLNALLAASSGHHSSLPLNPRKSRPTDTSKTMEDSFRLYFPTKDYVANSTGGLDNGGTIWLNKEHYTRDNFPRQVFREYRSTRRGLLSHCKLLFVRGIAVTPNIDCAAQDSKASVAASFFSKRSATTNGAGKPSGTTATSTSTAVASKPVAFLYHGSANCSESAWGTATVEKKAGPRKGEAKLMCRNWEAGVLIPVLGPGDGGGMDAGPASSGPAEAATTSAASKRSVKPNVGDPEETESETESEGEGEGEDAASGAHAESGRQRGGNDEASVAEVPGWNVFKDVIDGPFEHPAPAFGGKEPWYVMLHMRNRGRAVGEEQVPD